MPSAPGPSPFTDHKESVRVASTADIVLADLPDIIDGVTMSYGDRFLVKDQDDATQNGIYIWLGELETGEVTTGGRGGQLTSGALVIVEEGDTHADTLWMLSTDDPIEVGETALTFIEVGASGGGGGFNPDDDQTINGAWDFANSIQFLDNVQFDQPVDFDADVAVNGDVTAENVLATTVDVGGITLSNINGPGGSTLFSGFDVEVRNLLADQGVDVSNFLTFSGDNAAYLHTGGTGAIEVIGVLKHPAAPVDLEDVANKDYVDTNAGAGLGDNNAWTGTNSFGNEWKIDGDAGGWGIVRSADIFFETVSAASQVMAGKQDGDSNDRWKFSNEGRIFWGNGSSAPTAMLGFDGADIELDGVNYFHIGQGSSTFLTMHAGDIQMRDSGHISFIDTGSVLIDARLLGDVNDRMRLTSDGTLEMGDGISAPDTNLYRVGPAELKTDGGVEIFGDLHLSGPLSTIRIDGNDFTVEPVMAVRAPGDPDDRFHIWGDGSLAFGDGTASPNATMGYLGGLLQINAGGDGVDIVDGGAGTVRLLSSAGEVKLESFTGTIQIDAPEIGFYGATPVVQSAAIPDAAGGVVIDAEARAAINDLLQAVRDLGIVAP